MSYLYSDILTSLDASVRNKKRSVTNLRQLINDGVRSVINKIDLMSTKRITKTLQSLHDDIYRYATPADMKKEAIIDIRKYKHYNKPSYTRYVKVPSAKFNIAQKENVLAFEYSDGLSWLKGNFSNANDSILVHDMDSLTDNGTWSAADNGENIKLNEANYLSGDASIEVDMAASGTTLSIVNSTLEEKDLSDITKLFSWVYLPSASDISNINQLKLRYGSDSSNYNEATADAGFNLSELKQGWNLIAFGVGTATGSPDLTAVDYIKCSIEFSSTPGTLEGFLFDNILASQGEPFEFEYYSKFPWKNSKGTWKQNANTNSDELNVDNEEFEVIMSEINLRVAKAIPMGSSDIQLFANEKKEKMKEYRLKFPSERIKQRMRY